MIEAATNYIYENMGAIPLNANKSPKLPIGHNYLYELINPKDIDRLFLGAAKVGISCGVVSDGFECMDFDGHDNEPIREIFNKFMVDSGVCTIVELNNLPIIKTPSGGYHIYYKCDTIEGGKTLAKWDSGTVMIETRGNGQYVATIPSDGYELIKGSELIKLASITEDERDYLHAICEQFSKVAPTVSKSHTGRKWPDKFDITTAWGMYNEHGYNDVTEILNANGWEFIRTRKHDNVEMWRRPGKVDGISATIGRFHNMFYCFTDSFPKLEKEHGYNFFELLMILKFDGDKVETIKYLETKYNIIHYKPTVNKKTVNFPLDVFPGGIKGYITEQNKVSNFDVNLMSSTFLWLFSTLIGNKASTKVSDTWNVSPVIWLMVIAERGSSKTHAINAIIKPAKKIDSENRKEYEEQIKHISDEEKNRPQWKQIFLEDGTREGFVKAMGCNGGGLGLMKDELNGWLKDMDRHTGGSGGDEAFWLSSFNNSTYTKNIKGDDGTHVDRMFINLAGSIQPDVINEMAKNHSVNGLLDRFLFVPYEEKQFTFSLSKEPLTHFQYYCDFIKYAYAALNLLDGLECIISVDGADSFEECYNKLLTMKYKSESTSLGAYISKLITYFPRMALVIELIDQVCNDKKFLTGEIRRNSIMKAFDVIKYFLNNASNLFIDIGSKEDMASIIKASGAVKRNDKAVALLEAIERNEIAINDTEIARFTGMSKQLVSYYHKKVKESQKK